MTIGNRAPAVRPSGRRPDELRPVTFTLGVQKWAEGSCRIRVGDTEVLCAATIEDRVPPHLRGSGYTQASDRAAGASGGAKVEGYVYAHDQPDGVAAQQYLPDDLDAELAERSYYRPTDRGFEARLQDRWAWLRERLRRR